MIARNSARKYVIFSQIEPMTASHKTFAPMSLLGSALLVSGCSQPSQPVRSVQEFLDSPQFLEAAMVRCGQNRTETRYDQECVNARQAASIIEARDERARRDRLEAESEIKRDALRRTQRAAAEARRRAAEEEQLRREAEYLAQFGATPEVQVKSQADGLEANVPGVVLPKAGTPSRSGSAAPIDDSPPVIFDDAARAEPESPAATDGGNAPVAESDSQPLDAVREELRRRQEQSAQ